MRKFRCSRLAAAVLAVTAIAAVGSFAWAAVGGGGVISGCLSPSGYIRGIDDATGSCRTGDTALSWYTKEGADAMFATKSEVGLSSVEYKSTTVTGIGPTSQISRVVGCTSGKSILSGSYTISPGLTVTRSQPVDNPQDDAWWFEVRNDSSSTGDFTGWAICADA